MSYETGTIECDRCGSYYPHEDLCPGGCGVVVHVGHEPGCKGSAAYHASPGAGMGGRFHEYYDLHVAPPPNIGRFKVAPGVSLPDYHPQKGYRITSLADRKKLMRLNRSDYRSHPGRSEF